MNDILLRLNYLLSTTGEGKDTKSKSTAVQRSKHAEWDETKPARKRSVWESLKKAIEPDRNDSQSLAKNIGVPKTGSKTAPGELNDLNSSEPYVYLPGRNFERARNIPARDVSAQKKEGFFSLDDFSLASEASHAGRSPPTSHK